MKKPEIQVTVDVEGNVTVTTRGYKGKACVEASRFLEAALGNVSQLTHTSEYHTVGVQTKQHARR
jgi:hypothetical protein